MHGAARPRRRARRVAEARKARSHEPALRVARPSFGRQPLRELGSVVAITAIVVVLIGRVVSVYPLALLFVRSRWRLPLPYQHVLFWGGLRGALALALALAVPVSVPERSGIIVAAFLVVAFSILVQGLTMPWLLKHFALTERG